MKKVISISLKIIALILTIMSIVLISILTLFNIFNNPQYDPEFWQEDFIESVSLIWTIVVLLYTSYRLFRSLLEK